MKAAAYLYFKHNAKEAIEAYKEIFGAEVVCEYVFSEEMTADQELIGKIFHAELKIGDLNLYVSDSGEEASFSSMKFVVEYGAEGRARKCFEKLVHNGREISDFEKMPFGPTIASAEDKSGIRGNPVANPYPEPAPAYWKCLLKVGYQESIGDCDCRSRSPYHSGPKQRDMYRSTDWVGLRSSHAFALWQSRKDLGRAKNGGSDYRTSSSGCPERGSAHFRSPRDRRVPA